MASNPIQRKLLADIDAAGGWAAIWERVASGETQTAIAASFGVSQGFFSRGGVGAGVVIQRATPPWCEQVPRRCALNEYEPSRQRAVASTGWPCPRSDARPAAHRTSASVDNRRIVVMIPPQPTVTRETWGNRAS